MIYTMIPYANPPEIKLAEVTRHMMSLLPDDGWACIMDHDAMHVTLDWYPVMSKAIENAEGYSALYPTLSRSPCVWQDAGVTTSNIEIHRDRAMEALAQHGHKIIDKTDVPHTPVGACMLIRVKSWRECGLADERRSQFYGYDSWVQGKLKQAGKAGHLPGIYVYHRHNSAKERNVSYVAYYAGLHTRWVK